MTAPSGTSSPRRSRGRRPGQCSSDDSAAAVRRSSLVHRPSPAGRGRIEGSHRSGRRNHRARFGRAVLRAAAERPPAPTDRHRARRGSADTGRHERRPRRIRRKSRSHPQQRLGALRVARSLCTRRKATGSESRGATFCAGLDRRTRNDRSRELVVMLDNAQRGPVLPASNPNNRGNDGLPKAVS